MCSVPFSQNCMNEKSMAKITAVTSIYFIHCMKHSGKRVFTLQFASQSGNPYCIATVHDEAEASYRELTQRSSSVIARVRSKQETW